MESRSKSCIRLANTGGLWNASNGRNGLNLSVSVPEPGQAFFTEDASTDFPNPERGWMVQRTDGTNMYPFYDVIRDNAYNHQCTVEFLYIDLYDYRNTDTITQGFLDGIASQLATTRAAGHKVVLRFAYGRDSTNYCPEYARVALHIDQLAPVVSANIDVICTLQTGMYGPWGEQWPSGTGTTWWYTDATSRRAFIKKWMDTTPSTLMLEFRYARDMADYADNTFATRALPFADRFLGGDQARLAMFCDSIARGESWGNTWGNDSGYTSYGFTELLDYSDAQGNYTSWGGESSMLAEAMSGVDTDVRLARVNIDYLQSNYYIGTFDSWQAEGWLAPISRKLGYRLVLNSVTAPETVTAGGSMSVTLNMSNTGYGKVFNPRPIDLVFVGSGGPFTARMTADARRNLPLGGQSNEDMTFTFTAPADLVAGQSYALHLRLPDPAAGLESDTRYAIRLANTGGLWDPNTGRNNLNLSVTVD